MSEQDNGNQAVALVPTGLGDDQLLAVAAAAEKRVEAVNKIKILALKVTNERDWTDQGGHPYLQVSGAEKVARLFGISWRLDEPTREEHSDGHFSYTFKGYFSMGTAEIEVVGTRSSQDPFFAGHRDHPKPPSEIDRNDVKKGAMTNCLGNGISRLLGIRNMTWEEIKDGGVDRSKIGKVDFKSSDPNEAMKLPNYGNNKGKKLDDPSVPISDLKYYLDGCEKTLADPEKKKFWANNEKLRDALKLEIAKREQALQKEASAAQPSGDTLVAQSGAITDGQWLDWRTMMNDDPDKAEILKACMPKGLKTLDGLVKDERRAFMLTCQDAMKKAGIGFEAIK